MKSSTGTGTGRFSPLKDAHDRIKAEEVEQKDAVVKQRHAAARREFSSAALEVADKSHGVKVLSSKRSEPAPATAAPAQDKAEQRPVRGDGQAPRPSWALHGMSPGGNMTHIVSGRMRAVRVQSEPSSTERDIKGAARQRSALYQAADRLFEKSADQKKAAPERAPTGPTERDGGDGVER